ncbi:MAG: phosphopentomutase [Pseudomonadota bacterium]
MKKRAFLFVMDSVGIGGAPDAATYGDEGANTFGHIAERCAAGRAEEDRTGPLKTPNLDALGMGAACAASVGRVPPGLNGQSGAWAVGREISNGKDTPSGHWELAGAPVLFDWGYFPETIPCFPADLIDRIVAKAGLPGVLGQKHSNGMAIISECAAEHIATGKPILYTSADSVFQIAAHEEAFGLDRLLALCEIAREEMDALNIGRVIARPFVGREGSYTRTSNRRDYSVPPPEPTICDRVVASGGRTISIGKIGDIFAHQGISEIRKRPGDAGLFDLAVEVFDDAAPGDLVFANFVEFDSLYGHPRDVSGYARALEWFDSRLPEVTARLDDGDLLIITADHGNDPTWPGTDHTREQVPILMAGPGVAPGGRGIVGFADVAETIAAHLGMPTGPNGKAIL